ncbi:hypothetical protein ACIA8K_26910 [Catenuloplanes sp. NPDC051500]|uniref:hypothetical protein n=1 Tax=Catenuloplanes sp. NPDC051500 TaxID=3363959 RepID=UPI00379CDBA4
MSFLGANSNSADGPVDVQAGVVLGDIVHTENNTYNVPPGASPAERFEIGLSYLAGGVPSKAQEVIEEAMAAGHRTSRVRFYWVLAMLSGRTLSQLTDEDETRLQRALDWPRLHADDEWVEGLRVIERFLTAMDTPKDDPQTAVKAFDELPDTQRKAILRHLELFLKDNIQDAMWQRALAQAREDQTAGDRSNRVWIYFQPRPRRPRAATPVPESTTAQDWAIAWAASVAFLAATACLGLLVVLSGSVTAMLAALMGAASIVLMARDGVEWRFRSERLRAKDVEHQVYMQPTQATPESGFADAVDRLFWRYVHRYRPRDVDKDEWITQMSGVHRTIRDQIVTSFRDSPVRAEEIAWLIRHRISDARARWHHGTLLAYREQLRMPLAKRALVIVSAAVLAGSTVWVVPAAFGHAPIETSAVVLIMLITARIAGGGWLKIKIEQRRYAADLDEAAARLRTDEEAFARWAAKLARRPTDREMATWLDCDRRILMNRAMQHYNLAPRHVIASAFIAGAGKPAQRARLRNGPWRYSRYRILVFLLTEDGVRQMAADLDFITADIESRNRTNYRYEAVASVHVTEANRARPTFRLTLLNGEPIDVEVTEADLLSPEIRPDSRVADMVSLDSTGLTNTLHVLEGIAAEGKQWVHLDRRRRGNRISVLKKTIDTLMR